MRELAVDAARRRVREASPMGPAPPRRSAERKKDRKKSRGGAAGASGDSAEGEKTPPLAAPRTTPSQPIECVLALSSSSRLPCRRAACA